MKSGKLYKVLSRFSKEELKNFDEFLRSPVFNKRELIVELFELYRRHILDNEQSGLSEKDSYIRLYPSQSKVSLNALRQLKTILTQLAFEFIRFKNYNIKSELKDLMLVEGLKEMEMWDQFDKQLSNIRSDWEENRMKDSDYFGDSFRLSFTEQQAIGRKGIRRPYTPLVKAVDELDNFYVLEKLSLILLLLQRQRMYGIKSNIELPKITAEQAEIPLVQIYVNLINMFIHPDDPKHYHRTIQLLNKHAPSFDKLVQRDLYFLALGFCIKKNEQGDKRFRNELKKIYLHLLDQEIILDNGMINSSTFKSIVVNMLKLDEALWVHEFMQKFGNKIANDHKQNAFNYNLGYYAMHKNKYREAARYFNVVLDDFKDVFYGTDCRSSLMICFLHLEEYDSLNSEYQRLRVYIERKRQLNSISSDRYNRLKSFNTFIHKLELLLNKREFMEEKFLIKLKALLSNIEQESSFPFKILFVEFIKACINDNKRVLK